MGNKSTEWQYVFDELDILNKIDSEGSFVVTANDIKKLDSKTSEMKLEARLMTKHDSSSQLPDIMAENGLSLLTETSNSWRIGHFEVFKKVDNSYSLPTIRHFESEWETLPLYELSTETRQLNYAAYSGILEDFLEEERLVETISGKCSGGHFQYFINDTKTKNPFSIIANNPRIEIDKVYETEKAIYVIEAKQFGGKDFLIRQLYYPYRLISSMPNVTKPVVPLHVIYSDGIYMLERYVVDEHLNYNSLRLEKKESVRLSEKHTRSELVDLLQSTDPCGEPDTTFPQANVVPLLLHVFYYLSSPHTAKEIADYIGYAGRQGNYYGDALVYLGFARKNHGEYKAVTRAVGKDFDFSLAKRLCELPIFRRVLVDGCQGRSPDKDMAVKYISEGRADIGDGTPARRAGTLASWCEYILKIFS